MCFVIEVLIIVSFLKDIDRYQLWSAVVKSRRFKGVNLAILVNIIKLFTWKGSLSKRQLCFKFLDNFTNIGKRPLGNELLLWVFKHQIPPKAIQKEW